MPALPDQPTTTREGARAELSAMAFELATGSAVVEPPAFEAALTAFAAAVRAAAFAEIADDIVAHCFGHTIDAAEGYIDCHCEVADDLLHQLAAPTTTTPEEH